MRLFANRKEAGVELAEALSFLRDDDTVVLAVSNGAVLVAEAIARHLKAPLDILLLARLAAPRMPSHVVGAVDEFGRISLIESTARWHHLTTQKMITPAREAFRELQSRRAAYRAAVPDVEVRGKVVVVVDDGVSDGASILAAIASVRDRGARKIVVAAPAGSQQATWQLHTAAHHVVIPHTPVEFRGVEKFYTSFPAVGDGMAIEVLRTLASQRHAAVPQVATMSMRYLAENERMLYCEADVPPGDGPFPAVVFVHGIDSDGRSPRTLPLSRRLAKRGVMGIRPDFLGHGRSDGAAHDCTPVAMLNDLRTILENIALDPRINRRRVGLCGAGLGGLIALHHAAGDRSIRTLVVRGPVCGGEVQAAAGIHAPTLIIHAEADTALADDVRGIDRLLGATHHLLLIPECNRLFNDPISLELMISASVDWLVDHLHHGPEAPEPSAAADASAAVSNPAQV